MKSLVRKIVKSDGVIQNRKEYLMKKRISSDGYYIAKLNVNKKSKSVAIHILVAQHFIPNPDPLYKIEVNHKDCNRINNCIDNLEWCTHKENVEYSAALGHYKTKKDDKNGRAVKVRIILEENKYIDFNCMGQAAQYLIDNGYTNAKINSIRGSIKKAVAQKTKYLGLQFE